MVIMWLVFGIFVVMSLILLSGRGAFLIAGYNTASPEEKKKYNEKKLCRVVGAGMLVVTVLLFVMALWGEALPPWFGGIFLVVILVDVVGMLYFTNKKCFAENVSKAEAEPEKGKKASKWSMVIVVLSFLAAGILCFTGNVRIQCGEASLQVKATYWTGLEIPYEEIEKMEYRTDIAAGSRVGGFGSPRLLLGNFKNQEFGNYVRYTYAKCKDCIVVTANGKNVVINGEDEENTRAIYEALVERKGSVNPGQSELLLGSGDL